jgi:catechol 2,3-dioxygenase-like lactoylglutathione lyase family enzyme
MAATRLASVVLLVRDVPRGLRFYRDGLGLAVTASTETFARVAVSDAVTLDLRAAGSEAQCSAGYSPLLTFAVSDMDGVVPRLLGMGAALDGAVRYNDYGRTAAVRSPDGHMVGLYEAAGIADGGDATLAAAAAARARERSRGGT